MVWMIGNRRRRSTPLGRKEIDMSVIKKLKQAATKEVVGTVLKSGSAPAERAVGHKGKLAIAAGVIAAALGYAANYL